MKSFIPIICTLIMASCINTQKADLIIYNGVIYTVDSNFSIAQAMAVRDGKIMAIGTNEEIRMKYAAPMMTDLMNHPVYPGFIDAHCHFLHYGLDLGIIDLVGTKSYREVLKKVTAYADTNLDGWIVGRGWDQNDWAEQRFPDKASLDSLFPSRPVALRRVDGHAVLANNAALRAAGITTKTAIDGGSVELKDGRLTGVLLDNAADIVLKTIPSPGRDQKIDALLQAQEKCFAAGLTTVDDAGLERDEIMLIDSLQKVGVLKMRVYAMLEPSEENLEHFLKSGPYTTERLSVRAIKLYADGALGSRGACLLQPYYDIIEKEHYGFLLNSPEYLDEVAAKTYKAGFQLCTHCIGDSANRLMLNIYAKTLGGSNDRRWRIEHCQVVQPTDISKFGEFSVIPSVQPTHATSDMPWAENRLGAERVKYAYAYASLLKQNNVLPLGTDFPVEDISPVNTFYAAVFRKNTQHEPPHGFQTENALSRTDALRGMTIWAAYANFEEKRKGTLETGKLADFVMLDTDLMQAAEDDILQASVLSTFVSGEMVFSKE